MLGRDRDAGVLGQKVGQDIIRDGQAFVVMVGQKHVTHYRICEVVCFHKLVGKRAM